MESSGFPIIFEDELLVAINKPAGVVVNKSDSANAFTVQEWMEGRLFDTDRRGVAHQLLEEFDSRGGVVHRLDKDTSGVLLLAKSPAAFQWLKSQFKERTTSKKYLTLVHGLVSPSEGEINAPIERNPFNRMHFGVFPGGREAISSYRTIANFRLKTNPQEQFSLLEVTPKTGRTHQIRVHMKYINHSVVADPIYAGRKVYRDDLEWCPRLFLHAQSLTIVHPGGEKMEFKAPIPTELETVLSECLQKE